MKRFAFLTDVHLDGQFPLDNNVNPGINFERIIADLSKKDVKEIVFGGDIGQATSHFYFFNLLHAYSVKLILGNHDNFKEVTQHYKPDKIKDELYYKLEDEDYKYLFLDTSSDELSQVQIKWLKRELITFKRVIIFIHHPVIEINTPIDKLYPLKNRDAVRLILVESQKKVTIFCGHYHMNDECIHKNIKQITTQSISFQVVKSAQELKVDTSNFGYRMIEIDAHKIESEIIVF